MVLPAPGTPSTSNRPVGMRASWSARSLPVPASSAGLAAQPAGSVRRSPGQPVAVARRASQGSTRSGSAGCQATGSGWGSLSRRRCASSCHCLPTAMASWSATWAKVSAGGPGARKASQARYRPGTPSSNATTVVIRPVGRPLRVSHSAISAVAARSTSNCRPTRRVRGDRPFVAPSSFIAPSSTKQVKPGKVASPVQRRPNLDQLRPGDTLGPAHRKSTSCTRSKEVVEAAREALVLGVL
jgi:hypothetical protein